MLGKRVTMVACHALTAYGSASVLMFCSAVTLLVPVSMNMEAVKEECQLLFDGQPSFITLLDRIEQEPKAVRLEEVNSF